jgi:NodT family efflux transporter outer membrane factor (OMF) lipoprotein
MAAYLSGCTSPCEYVKNGFKVGPNYCPPQAPVAEHWIDQADLRVEKEPESLRHWWTVFNDPKLHDLIVCAYRQNLTLRQAGFRVLQARAVRQIAVGDLFPQNQEAFGDYRRAAASVDPSVPPAGNRFFNSWDFGFNLNWELDFWGRFRRAVAAADKQLDASVEDYDAVLVTLLGDVATNYVRVRTDQERIRLLQFNVDNVQMAVWQRTRARAGFDIKTGQIREGMSVVTKAEADVAESTLKQTIAAITQLEIDRRQAENQLCILLGIPPEDLSKILGTGPIPQSPPQVIVDIPAELLRRRPDVRRAERLAASQAEEIGIALADLYPAFSINGTMRYDAENFRDLFRQTAFNGSVGPSFQWNLLNYGRIINNARAQDAYFQQLVLAYQSTVLQANREVEDGLVTFLQAQRRAAQLQEAYLAQASAVDIAKARYLEGVQGETSFSTYTLYEQNLINVQDLSAQALGQIAQGLITVYRALGGGWEIRLDGGASATTRLPLVMPNPPEQIAAPQAGAPGATGLPPVPKPPPPAPQPPVQR